MLLQQKDLFDKKVLSLQKKAMIENDVKRIKEVLFPEIKNLKEFHSIYPVRADFKPEVGQKINEMNENFDFENYWLYNGAGENLLIVGDGVEYAMPFQPFIFGGFMFDILRPLKKPRLDLDRIIKKDERHLKFCKWFEIIRHENFRLVINKYRTRYGELLFDIEFIGEGFTERQKDAFINFYNTYKK